jgi:hypothetical protein
MDPNIDLALRARKRAEDKAGFFVHLGMYAIVNAFLASLWWLTTSGTAFAWFVFPLAGWGLGVVAHFLAVFFGEGYVDRMARRELERLRHQRG